MTSGLLAPLSPPQEIALRRIAHGSLVIDARTAAALVGLALVERTNGGFRLTPLGRLRFNALPKAPLLGQQRSVHAATGYVEGLIEKAQSRSANQDARTKGPPPSPPVPPPSRTDLLLEAQDRDSEELPAYQPIYLFFDSDEWKSRAAGRLIRMRRAIMEHRERQVRLCDASTRRIDTSRLLLKTSVPVRPGWLAAAS